MIEWLIPSVLLLGAAFIPKGKMKEQDKINLVFKNCRICVSDGEETKYPKLIKKPQKKQIRNTYDLYL